MLKFGKHGVRQKMKVKMRINKNKRSMTRSTDYVVSEKSQFL